MEEATSLTFTLMKSERRPDTFKSDHWEGGGVVSGASVSELAEITF